MNKVKDFYHSLKENRVLWVVGIFIIADVIANVACALLFSDFATLQGVMFSLSGIAVGAAIALALPIIGFYSTASRMVFAWWVVFMLVSFGMSFVAGYGRMELASHTAEKSALLYKSDQAALGALGKDYLTYCKGQPDETCKVTDAVAHQQKIREQVSQSDYKWSVDGPDGITVMGYYIGDMVKIALIFALAIASSAGSSIISYTLGLKNAPSVKKSGASPRLAA